MGEGGDASLGGLGGALPGGKAARAVLAAALAAAGAGAAPALAGRAGVAAAAQASQASTVRVAGAAVGVAVGVAAAPALERAKGRAAGRTLRGTLAQHSMPGGQEEGAAGAAAAAADTAGEGAGLEELGLELQALYQEFLEQVLPPGERALRGDEAHRLRAFMGALGLDEELAAECHIDLGLGISRRRMEQGDTEGSVSELRAFQKLVFVSDQVFGKRSGFLTPWRRIFNLTESQLELAKSDNARHLFRARLHELLEGKDYPSATDFQEARKSQTDLQLPDSEAAEEVIELSRARLERFLDEADQLSATPEETLPWVEAAVGLASHIKGLAPQSGLVPGAADATLRGGKWEGRTKELRELLCVYARGSLARDKGFTPAAQETAKGLEALGGLEGEASERALGEVVAKGYRTALARAYADGSLEAEESKAAWLQVLCQRYSFDAAKALKMHEDIYRGKMAKLLDKGYLTEEDDTELGKMQKLLCVQAATAKEVAVDIKGKAFDEVLDRLFKVGQDAFGRHELDEIESTLNNLRCENDIALSLLTRKVQAKLMTFVEAARGASNDEDRVTQYMALANFNAVVSLILESVDPEEAGRREIRVAEAEVQTRMVQAQRDAAGEGTPGQEDRGGAASEEAKVIGDSEKVSLEEAEKEAAREKEIAYAKLMARGQRTITLKGSIEEDDAARMYRTYFTQLLQGQRQSTKFNTDALVAYGPEDFAKLQVFADLVGLTPEKVTGIQSDMAERTFTQNVQQIFADPTNSNEERMREVNRVRIMLGLSQEKADECLKGLSIDQGNASVQDLLGKGQLTQAKVRELVEYGTDVAGALDMRARLQVYRRGLEAAVATGTGAFDRGAMLKQMPKDIGMRELEQERVLKEVISKDRKRTLLVQAVSSLRQGKALEALVALNNLIACFRALPGESLAWSSAKEQDSAFSLLVSKDSDADKAAVLQQALGLGDERAAKIRAAVASEGFSVSGLSGSEEEDLPF